MNLTFLLLTAYTMIDILICEVIENEGSSETHHQNASAMLDRAILRNDMDNLDYISVPKDSLNLTSVSWPITRTLRDENKLSNFKDSVGLPRFITLPVTKTPKSRNTSVNLPSRAPEGRQIIPARQSMYPNWKNTPVKTKKIAVDNQKSNQGGIYDTVVTDLQETDLVPTKVFPNKMESRQNEGINRQYLGYDDNGYGPHEDYASPEKYFSSTNYEPENTNAYTQKYVSQNDQYGPENYNSYYTDIYRNNRYYENSADFHSGSSDPWSMHRSRPSLAYPRFTVDHSSHDDPAHGRLSPSLIAIFYAIGSNLLNLFKIGLGSGLSIALPIIAIKFLLIPLKILKFIKIVKILLKLIFVVPFVLRVFAPSIYSAIGPHDSGFSNKMEGIVTSKSRDVVDQVSESSSWLNRLAINITSALPDVVRSQECPSRVACELGSYLASRSKLSEKFIKFLANDDHEKGKDFNEERNEKEEVTRAFVKALTQRWTYDQCDVFACGISL